MKRICKYIFKILFNIINNIVFYLNRGNYIFSPVFIIGCGRSGTTVLGETLSQHVQIKYLNERRDLWHKSYPEFDIWSSKKKKSKIYADEEDFIPYKHNMLHFLFFKEQVLAESKILLEKLPINSFRLDFIEKSFPNARYIYLTRNGLEVSKSIEKSIKKGNWFRNNDLLELYDIEEGNHHRGMWEWKLSIEHSDRFFRNIDSNRFIHLSYKDFMDSPSDKVQDIFDFLELDYTDILLKNISNRIKRRSPEIKTIEDPSLHIIGGDILDQTIHNIYTPS